MHAKRSVVVVAILISLTGCLSIRPYVDPQLPKVGYGDLLARPSPRPIALTTTFQRNGKGSKVTDGYIFTASFRAVGKDPVTKVYRHAIHTTIGNAEGPPGLVAEESLQTAFDKVVEGLVLNLLRDLQKEELL